MMMCYQLQVAALAMVLFILMIEPTSANNKHCHDGCKVATAGLSCQTCKHGCYGDRCSQRCRLCDSAGCDRETGRCHRCRRRRYGEACHKRCLQCPINAHCDRFDGTCIFVVLCSSTDRYPRKCKHSMCRTKNGHYYLGCKRGWKGAYCDERGSSNCLHNVCYDNGVCKHGCTSGFYGQRCDRKCSTGVTAECDRLTGCSSTCRHGLCHPFNGSCSQGCTQGWTGPYCNERYSELNCSCCSNKTCKYGCQPGVGGHCTGGGHEHGELNLILLITGAFVVIATVMASIAVCCTRKGLRRMTFLKMRKKQVEIAYTKRPVYLGIVPKEVQLKQ